MRLYFLYFIISTLVLFSCSSDGKEGSNKDSFVADTLVMEANFTPFEDSRIPQILEDANLCTNIPKDSLEKEINMFDPPCMANFYKVFKYNNSKDLAEGFGVVLVKGLHDFPLRQTILFVKEGSKYVVMDRFVGDIVEMRTARSGYNDLIIRHRDLEAGSFAIRYVYQNGKYEPLVAEEIDDALIKPEYVDSLSKIIISRILKQKMFQ